MTYADLNLDLRNFSGTRASSVLQENVSSAYYKSGSSSILSDSAMQLFRLQSLGVKIEDFRAVEEFLASHSGLISYLDEIPSVVISRFGNVLTSLVVFNDPDSIGNEELFLEIETKDDPLEANKKLNELNRSWLLNIDDEDAYLFNTSLIFIR